MLNNLHYIPTLQTGNTTLPLFKSHDQLDTITYTCNSSPTGGYNGTFLNSPAQSFEEKAKRRYMLTQAMLAGSGEGTSVFARCFHRTFLDNLLFKGSGRHHLPTLKNFLSSPKKFLSLHWSMKKLYTRPCLKLPFNHTCSGI